MNDDTNQLPSQAEPTQPTTTEQPLRKPLRDRVLGMRAVAGVAIASVILGGAGGAALGAVSAGVDTNGPGGRGGFGGPGGNGQGQQPPGLNGQNGQDGQNGQPMQPPGLNRQQPTTPPQD